MHRFGLTVYRRARRPAPRTVLQDVPLHGGRSAGLPTPPHLRRDCAHPCHICAGTGLAAATSALGLSLHYLRCRCCMRTATWLRTFKGSMLTWVNLPRLRRDWDGLTPATSAPGLDRTCGGLWTAVVPGELPDVHAADARQGRVCDGGPQPLQAHPHRVGVASVNGMTILRATDPTTRATRTPTTTDTRQQHTKQRKPDVNDQ